MISKERQVCLLLDNIRSVHNVGSIFRTADTLGISKIYCIGTTPTPLDRFGRKRKDFSKVSLGAEDSVKWEHVGSIAPNATFVDVSGSDERLDSATRIISQANLKLTIKLVKALKREGFQIIALEQSSKSIDYKIINVEKQNKILVILGNEVEGVNKKLLDISDVIAEIPMMGEKESLNVSVASAVFLYRLLDK